MINIQIYLYKELYEPIFVSENIRIYPNIRDTLSIFLSFASVFGKDKGDNH